MTTPEALPLSSGELEDLKAQGVERFDIPARLLATIAAEKARADIAWKLLYAARDSAGMHKQRGDDCLDRALKAESSNAALSAKLAVCVEALGFGKENDAYYNLGGAIIDIERSVFPNDPHTDYICDGVCLRTLKRVEIQLGKAYQALRTARPGV